MELRQLEYFVAVVEAANFTRGADRVGISQSGVSAQIRRLETELGQPLLDRSERTVRPTAAGAAVLPHARAVLAAVASTRLAVDDVVGLVRGTVTVGMVTACSVTGLFEGLADFHAAFPGVEITLVEGRSDQLVDEVRSRQLDLALAGSVGGLPAEIDHHVLADERLVAAVHHGHPLADRTTIAVSKLCREPLISLSSGSGVRTAFEQACAARRLEPRLAFEASGPDVVADLAGRGLGVAVLSESMVAGHRATLHPMAIVDPVIRSQLGLIWRRGEAANPAAIELRAYLRAALAPT